MATIHFGPQRTTRTMAMHILVPCVTILFFFLLPLLKKKFNGKNRNIPPGPPSLPIVGNMHLLGKLPHQSLWELSKKYGPIMQLQLGSVPTVVVSSVEAAKEVLKTHDLDCCSRPKLIGTGRLSYNYLDVAFAPYGDYWREMRKICVLELFNTRRVQSFQIVRDEEIASLMDSISQAASSGTKVDLSEKFLALTAGITCRIAFGKGFQGSEFDNFQEVIHEALAMLGSFSASDFFPYFGWVIDRITGLHTRLEKNFYALDAFYRRVIDQHRNSKKSDQEQEDIVDMLLRLQKNQNEFGSMSFGEDHIKALLMNIFLAGVDTASIIMEWTMAELARNPRIMKKAQDEVRTCIRNKDRVTVNDIEQLKYLNMVIKETMRLHPPSVLLIPRETMNRFKMNNYDIYSKTRIQVNVWSLGRDPNLWENPLEYIPERFLNSSIDYKGQHFELLPFGAGRRGCPAISMGVTMVEQTLANLLYCFDWTLPDGMKEEDIDMQEGAGLTVYKKVPICLVPVKPHLDS